MADMPSMNPSADADFNIQVSGRHMDLGDAFRSRVDEALSAAVGKYFDRGGSGEVRVSRDGHLICVDVVLLLGTGQQLVARGAAGDAHGAFDDALAKLTKQVRRYHRELTSHHPHKGGTRSPADRAPLSDATAAIDHDEDDSDETGEWGADGSAGAGAPRGAIIAETSPALKTLTVAMAAMDLEATGLPVVLFRNVAHGGVSVVYRRTDGNIGWLDPERVQAGSNGNSGASAPNAASLGASA